MSVETKTPELAMLEKLEGQINNYVKALEGYMKKEDLKPLNEALEALKNGTADKTAVSEVKKGLETLSTLFEEMREDVLAGKNKNIRQIISPGEAFIQKMIEQKLDVSKFARESKSSFSTEVPMMVRKIAGTMETGNVDAVGTNSIPFELADFEFGLTRIARRAPYLLSIANVSPISTMYAQWAEQENPDGTVTAVSEGSDKPQIDFDWVEKSAKVEKIAAFIKVTKEMLSDLPGIRNEIDTELRELVLLKADDDLLSGNGTSPNIKGILEYATPFSAPQGLGALIDNNFDQLRAAIAQVVEQKFIPNYIVMHPTDVAGLDLVKSASDGHYLMPPFKSADGMIISGVRIIENLGMTQSEFLVGDFTKWRVRIREAFNMDMGYIDDDFKKNLISILGEMRLVSYVKSNHTGAFVTGDLLTS